MPPEHVLEELSRIKESEDSNPVDEKGAVDVAVIPEDGILKEESWPHSKIRINLENTTVFFINSRTDMSLEEFHGVWFQIFEFSAISSSNRLTVKLMRQQGHLDNEPDKCIRGLEHRLKGQNQRRKQIKLNAIDAVLNEQSSQRKFRAHDPHTISDVYKLHTVSIAAEAYRKGLNDEETVKILEKESAAPKPPLPHLGSDRRRSSLCLDEDDLKELQELDMQEEEDRFQQRVLDGGKIKKKGGVGGAMRKVGTFIRRGLTPPRRTSSEVSPKRGLSRTFTPPRRVKSELPKQLEISALPAGQRASSPKQWVRNHTMSPKFTTRKGPSWSPTMSRVAETKAATRPENERQRTIRRPSL
jgi:hypothetical protein